jgi:hypothetical protein
MSGFRFRFRPELRTELASLFGLLILSQDVLFERGPGIHIYIYIYTISMTSLHIYIHICIYTISKTSVHILTSQGPGTCTLCTTYKQKLTKKKTHKSES